MKLILDHDFLRAKVHEIKKAKNYRYLEKAKKNDANIGLILIDRTHYLIWVNHYYYFERQT